MWDAVGVADTVKRMQAAGERVSPAVETMLASGAASWYGEQRRARAYDPATQRYQPVGRAAGLARIASFRAGHDLQSRGIVRGNPGASLIDLGDGVACIELHSKKSAIGDDIMRLITKTLDPDIRCGA